MEDIYFTVKFARQKLPKYYAQVTPTTGMLLISAYSLDPFRMLRSLSKQDKGMHLDSQDKTSYTTKYHEAFLKHVENEYCAKQRLLPDSNPEGVPNKILFSSEINSRYGESFNDLYDSSTDVEEYLMLKHEAETIPGHSDLAECFLTAASLYLNSPPESPQN